MASEFCRAGPLSLHLIQFCLRNMFNDNALKYRVVFLVYLNSDVIYAAGLGNILFSFHQRTVLSSITMNIGSSLLY